MQNKHEEAQRATETILAVADKLIISVGPMAKHDIDVAVASLGVAMMSLAKAGGITRDEINELLDITEHTLKKLEN